jgi:hypothetical protein
LAFSYWIDNLGFITERKLAAIFIKPSLRVSNWPVIYFINYTPSNAIKFSGTIHHCAISNGVEPLVLIYMGESKKILFCFLYWNIEAR